MAESTREETGRKAANLYLDQQLKRDAIKLADERYGVSLSTLIERLLAREMSLKRGVLGAAGKKRRSAA